jgi:hypothetical protein
MNLTSKNTEQTKATPVKIAMSNTAKRVTGDESDKTIQSRHIDRSKRILGITVSTNEIHLWAFGFCAGIWLAVFLFGLLLYIAMAINVAELIMAATTTAMGTYIAWLTTANSIRKRGSMNGEPNLK